MQYFRCKCGKREMWTTDGAGPPCRGCEECGTTFAQSEHGHQVLQPHPPERVVQRYSDETGAPTFRLCLDCLKRVPNEQPATEAEEKA